MRKILSIIMLILLLTMPTFGQGDFQCTDLEVLQASFDVQDAASSVSPVLEDDQDMRAALNHLREAETLARNILAQCEGMGWSGTGNDVIGPLELGAGVYIVEYTGQAGGSLGVFSYGIENLDAEEFLFPEMITGQSGDSLSGRSSLRLEGGRYLLDVTVASLTFEGWTLTLTQP